MMDHYSKKHITHHAATQPLTFIFRYPTLHFHESEMRISGAVEITEVEALELAEHRDVKYGGWLTGSNGDYIVIKGIK